MQKLLLKPFNLMTHIQGVSGLLSLATYKLNSQFAFSTENKPQNLNRHTQLAPYKGLKSKQPFTRKFTKFMIQHIWPPLHPDQKIRKQMYKAYSLLSVSKICFIAMPMCLKYGTNAMNKGANIMNAPWYFLGYGALNLLNVVVDGQKAKVISKITLDTWRQVSVQTFNHLLELDSEFHSGPQQKQQLLSMYRFAHHYLEKDARQLLLYLLPISIDFLLTTSYLQLKCGWKFLSSFLTTACIFTTYTFKRSYSRQLQLKKSKGFDHQGHFLVSEALSNYNNVKLFDSEEYEKKQFEQVLQNYIENKYKDISSLWNMTLGQKIIFVAGMTWNLFFAALQVKAGKLNIGDLASIQTFMFQLMAPVNQLGNIVREIHETMFEIKQLCTFLEQEPKIKNCPSAQDFHFKSGELTFEGVRFSYLPGKPIIQNVDLQIKEHTFVTIVGEIGSGKTTMIKLLLRFIDPEEGRVLIDGQDIKNLKIESFRKYISTVSQQTYIFNDTIMYNLQYANQAKTKEDIIKTCKQLKLHNYIMSLPQQYNTKIGDQGNQFSGGERQRLAIARCLLKDTPILLFDEPTSNLDSQYEDNFAAILKEMKQQKTIVVVTHRLRLASQADKVVFLKKLGGVSQGTHYQLVENDEEYKLMCRQLSQPGNDCLVCSQKISTNLKKKKHGHN